MAFIGIIADNKNEMHLKKVLSNIINSNGKEHTLIEINNKSIENIKNIKFETILVMDLSRVKNEDEVLTNLFKNSKYLVVNSDMEDGLNIINNLKLNIITFGFNSKSTVTASSVEDNFIICIQRKLINIYQTAIEPQELEVKPTIKKLSNSSHNLMGIASILLIYGKEENFF